MTHTHTLSITYRSLALVVSAAAQTIRSAPANRKVAVVMGAPDQNQRATPQPLGTATPFAPLQLTTFHAAVFTCLLYRANVLLHSMPAHMAPVSNNAPGKAE